jgi:uncharacterized protein (DUF697 family)
MERKARRITNVYSGVAAVTAFVTQPIPGGDELIVIPIHYAIVVRLARARGVSVFKLPWRSIQRVIWYGAAARLVANFSMLVVPFLGAFSNSITAIALTEYLSRWMDEFLSHPEQPPPEVTMESLKALFTSAIKKARIGKDKDKDGAAKPNGAPGAGEGKT